MSGAEYNDDMSDDMDTESDYLLEQYELSDLIQEQQFDNMEPLGWMLAWINKSLDL